MKRKRFAGKTLLLTLTAMLVAAPAFAALHWPWPDTSKHPRVILYADQNMATDFKEHPDWFAKDFVVAGFYISKVVYGQSDEAIRMYGYLHQKFIYNKIYLGSYMSATTVIHELSLTKYPADAVSMEELSPKTKLLGPWMRDGTHQVVDLTDPASRKDLQNNIHLLWAHVPVQLRFLDNAAVHPRVAAGQPWAAYCANMKELRKLAEYTDANTMFNVFVRPWEMSDEETKQLIDAVGWGNAVSLPLPWSKSIKDDKNANAWAIYRYRQMLKAGLAIVLVPSDDAPEEALVHWVSTWKQKGDHIYYAFPEWKAPTL